MSTCLAVNIDERRKSSQGLNDETVGKTKRTMSCYFLTEGPGKKGVEEAG